jgi:hypothetical protein
MISPRRRRPASGDSNSGGELIEFMLFVVVVVVVVVVVLCVGFVSCVFCCAQSEMCCTWHVDKKQRC